MHEYWAKVYDIVDGDTFDAKVELGFNVFVDMRFRLADVDTPEIYRPESNEEYKKGIRAKEYVEEQILNNWVIVRNKGTDKYGRYIAEVFFGSGSEIEAASIYSPHENLDNLSKRLIDNDLANHYEGG